MSQRKTVVQRAEAVKAYPQPRNVVIQYEAPQVRVIRQFQRLGVTPENPQEYLQRYGASLLDIQTLIQQARAAGIVEDIVSLHSPPFSLHPIFAFSHHPVPVVRRLRQHRRRQEVSTTNSTTVSSHPSNSATVASNQPVSISFPRSANTLIGIPFSH